MSIAFMSREVEDDPAVDQLWPAPLWPPLRTASSRPVSRASAIDADDIVGVGDPDDDRRSVVGRRRTSRPGAVVLGVVRADHPAATLFRSAGIDSGVPGVVVSVVVMVASSAAALAGHEAVSRLRTYRS